MNWRGPKTRDWEAIRRELVKQFAAWGVTRCEFMFAGCWRDNALGFSHLKKRRKLTREELYEVVLSCNPCHDKIENLPEAQKMSLHRRVIEIRWKTLSLTSTSLQPPGN